MTEQTSRQRWPLWRHLRRKECCSATRGCTQKDGHEGDCKVYRAELVTPVQDEFDQIILAAIERFNHRLSP